MAHVGSVYGRPPEGEQRLVQRLRRRDDDGRMLATMCGIAGFVGDADPAFTSRALETLSTRGPDGGGYLDRGGVHLLHRRLAILDLTPTGAQPMESIDGAIAISYNGELYNYDELRDLVAANGLRPRGTSDTEIILLAFELLDTDLFARMRGMFALAIHDRRDDRLILARDHLGIKPLYFRRSPRFAFASSARLLASMPDASTSVDIDSLRELLHFRYVPTQHTMWREVEPLPPGSFAVWRRSVLSITTFWRPPDPTPEGDRSIEDWSAELDDLMAVIVRQNLRADVPVAALLSGGVDSGYIVTRSVEAGSRPTCFTYAMTGALDETRSARGVAEAHGCEHVEVVPIESDYESQFHGAITSMDAPVVDSIVVPTDQLLRAVARRFKVVLTGEGADELFAGYAHMRPLTRLSPLRARSALARIASTLLAPIPSGLIGRAVRYPVRLGLEGKRQTRALVQAATSPSRAVQVATSIFAPGDSPLGDPSASRRDEYTAGVRHLGLDELIRHGYRHWLPNQILNKMDQLSMAHGLEARVPYVDPRLVEFAARIPPSVLYAGMTDKLVLRRAASRVDDRWLTVRKRPFFVPPYDPHLGQVERLADTWLSTDAVRRAGLMSEPHVSRIRERLARREFLGEKQATALIGLLMWLSAHT